VYIGTLEPGKGLETLLGVLHTCSIEKEWRLTIIGEGTLKGELVSRASALGILDKCTFLGFIAYAGIHDTLRHMHVGFAPYSSEPDYNFYCDPVKVKDYLASGVFSIVSNVPWIGQSLERLGIGCVYGTTNELKEAIERTAKLLSGTFYDREHVFQTARTNGIVSTWQEVFESGLSGLS